MNFEKRKTEMQDDCDQCDQIGLLLKGIDKK